MSIYVTLQSNASMDLYPENKITNFRNRLGIKITKPAGKWEVALAGMQYTAGLLYLRKGEALFERWPDPNGARKEYISSPSDATTLAEFTDALNKALPGSTFTTNKLNAAYSLKLKSPTEVIRATEKIRDLLGLKSNILTCSTQSRREQSMCIGASTFPMFLTAGNTKLFVYCDLIWPQFIADRMAQCLRVVSYTGNSREQKNLEFFNRHYMDLAISDFDTIHIYLRNELGELVPFEFGNLTITLHFREKKQ